MSDTDEVVTPGKTYGYDKLSKTELRKTIADLTKSVLELQENKKSYVDATNEVIRDTNSRIKSAVEALKYAEATGANAEHEANVLEFLKGAQKQ